METNASVGWRLLGAQAAALSLLRWSIVPRKPQQPLRSRFLGLLGKVLRASQTREFQSQFLFLPRSEAHGAVGFGILPGVLRHRQRAHAGAHASVSASRERQGAP